MANTWELLWQGKQNVSLRYPATLMHDLVWLRKPKSDVGKSNLPTDWKIKGKYVFPASDDFPTVCEVMEWLLSEVSEILISNLAQS